MGRKVIVLVLLLALAAGLAAWRTFLRDPVQEPPPAPVVLYVPLDNRPVNHDYVASLARMAGAELLIPPPALLNGGGQETDTAALWDWVNANATGADALVLSLDTLFYGGLVPSRTHHLTVEELDKRLTAFRNLTKFGGPPVYAFSIIMRSAASSASAGQPSYFAEYGNQLQRLSELADRADRGLATAEELAHRVRLEAQIPGALLDDYLGRRAANHEMALKVLDLVESGAVHYLAIGRDDTAPFSHTKIELRLLEGRITQLSGTAPRVDTYPGADEIGALLFARAIHDLNEFRPRVHIVYAAPGAERHIPRYEDISLQENVGLHIHSLGGTIADDPREADLVLLVNNPEGRTGEAARQFDGNRLRSGHREFAEAAAYWAESAPAVALADVVYANGADDALLEVFAAQGLLPRLAAYAGWNTAGNSIGTALAQGTLFSFYEGRDEFNREAYLECLLTRLVEDWGYQARVRPEIIVRYAEIEHGGTPIPEVLLPVVLRELEAELNAFTAVHLNPRYPDRSVRVTNVRLPWNRLFDIRFTVE